MVNKYNISKYTSRVKKCSEIEKKKNSPTNKKCTQHIIHFYNIIRGVYIDLRCYDNNY